MSNKRISELNELSAADIVSDDLFVVTDFSVLESKKIRASSIKNYTLDWGRITGSITHAQRADTASYLDGAFDLNVKSASYALSASYSRTGYWVNYSDTASYIQAKNVDGAVPSSSVSLTASYVLYRYNNGTIENAKTASYCKNAKSASYVNYTPGVDNGTITFAISAARAGATDTASYLLYTGIPNGTASFALNILNPEITASYLRLVSGRVNGTASYAISSSRAEYSNRASQSYFLHYSGAFNGTASYALKCKLSDESYYAVNATTCLKTASYASSSLSGAYARTSSYCTGTSSYAYTSSWCTQTASYALKAGSVVDPNLYRIYGPYSSDSQTTTVAYTQNFVINTDTGVGKTTIIEAIGDVKVPLTNTDVEMYIKLMLNYTEPGNTWSLQLDSCRVSDYINITAGSSGVTLSGYNRQCFALAGSYSLSGSWYRLSIETTGGATIDSRVVKFLMYTKADSLTKTSYPPY